MLKYGVSRWLSGKECACRYRRCRFNPWVGKIPWRRKWQPTAVFLPGIFHRQRSLAGYSPWGHKVGRDWMTEPSNTTTPSSPPSSLAWMVAAALEGD